MKKPLKGTGAPVTALRSDSHQRGILSKLDALRRRELLCDITLVVEDVHFKAHKALLAASSDFFSAMFAGEEQASRSTYRLDGTQADAFAAVLEFIYSAQVSVQEGAAEQLLAAARRVQVAELVKVLLAQRPAGVRGQREEAEPEPEPAKAPQPSKRKRGRPRKIVAEHDGKGAPGESAKVVQAAEAGGGEEEEEEEERPGPRDEEDNADAQQRRTRKRRIVPPLKYKAFKVGGDAAASKEPRRRGAKRKYPDTEARCDDCGKVFKNHLFLKIHQRTHTGEKPFRCSICGKSFTQKHTLLVHQRIHTGEKPFVCSICSKALATKHTLKEHMNLHKEEKPFSCDKCEKSFTQKSQLKSHYRLHTGKLLPECAECHHKFLDTAQLKKHLRIHTGEKPFTCEICGKCFTAKSTLQTHIRIHRGEKPYDCSICNKSFSDPSARRRHVASHSGKKPFTCSICNLSFTRLDNLKTHTNTHNKERAGAAPEPADSAVQEDEEARNLMQLQQFQEQEIQLVVTADVDNINFVQGQNQEISIITEEGAAPHSRLTLQNVALVEPAPQIQSIGVLDGPPAEQMHVITLSKEAMEQLQAHHGPPQPLHLAHRPVQQLQLMHPPILQEAGPLPAPGREPHAQAIHISSQSGQPISISQTSQQLSAHHIQGPTFQIQAGTVSYLYTTGLPHDS